MTPARPLLRLVEATPASEPAPAAAHALSDPGPSALGDASPFALTDASGAASDAARFAPSDAAADADAAAALLELDALLAADPPADASCPRLAVLAARVPGRQRQVVAALARAGTSAAVDALLALPPEAPGALEAVHRLLAAGVRRDLSSGTGSNGHVPADSLAPPLLALEFRGSRARGFPDLVRRAQALAAGPGAELVALDVAGKRRYRLAFWPARVAPAALAAGLRAAHLDLVWLHARLARLQGTRLWLSGWCLDGAGPHGPAAQAHLLQGWLRWAERGPGA